MDISVIIVNYNVREFLRGALESVERSLTAGKLTGEIFVVDNNSSDGSVDMVRTNFPSVKVIALDKNIGFGRANNLALREAKGEYLLILNPDTIVGEDTLRVMVDFMRHHPECGVSGCKLLNADGSFQISCRRGFPTPWASFTKLFGLSSIFPNSPLFSQYNLTYLSENETYEIDALAGAFMLLSREAFDRTGGFDEEYFMYGEDIDLSYRIKQAGLKVYYVHAASTIHFKGESTRRSVINEIKVFYEAMHIFVRKHYGSSIFFALLLSIGIHLRTLVAFIKKYRGAFILSCMDIAAVNVTILIISKILFGGFLSLPSIDYPWIFIVPPLVVVVVIAILGGYEQYVRRTVRPVLLAMPVVVIILSSLTYFFKEFTASRSLILIVTGSLTLTLSLNRLLIRLLDGIRFGILPSNLSGTLIAGTNEESLRTAELLRSGGLIQQYDIRGFIGEDISMIHSERNGLPVLGTIEMLPRIIREQRISRVIFPANAFPYTDMLLAMQRVSGDVETPEVTFSVIPQASDVILSKAKIEVISSASNERSVAVTALEFNIQKITHRIAKRTFDIVLSLLYLPFVALCSVFFRQLREAVRTWLQILRGSMSVVGIHPTDSRVDQLAKPGRYSLADITRPIRSTALTNSDIEQINLYYARNHTISMDIEILLRSVFQPKVRY